ncbi:NAD(P)H-dependent oxidoreductase subunit E [Aquincola sp. S2]|uniref:NAD(P)H-dependent oxidoreductase subunit E n=1 Tax=Pseudaquabacterium terrae TaxID=2732868 RepID=A0ABX2EQR4_9BURK|nr:NADH-ubiquinone oxidoreductase-F iron-sulfur binding region domain-containing protein [Aquabacterium terrae]NRF70856.1 NAD(P)H-dependent oxidoreductase subunit E [Aquabacterium terrae]
MTPDPASPPVAAPAADDRRRRGPGRLKGRQPEAIAVADVRALIGPGPHPRDRLIELLHLLNDRWGLLYERHLVALAAQMRLSVVEVYEVASFYHHFDVASDDTPAPRVTLRVCDGLACTMAGAAALHEGVAAVIGADVRLRAAPCVGRCEQAPVAVLGQRPLPQATPGAVEAALAAGEHTHPLADDRAVFDPAAAAPAALTPPDGGIAPAYVGYDAYRAQGGYRLAAAVAGGERSADDLIQALDDAGLRGLGGAGFPAGRKWRIVRAYPAPRLMAVNIDEGEPGTFKDRSYLERDPHRFLEGVLIAAQVVGTEAVYLYLRDEYHGCRALLERELARLQADPPCPLPRFELRRGAGAYICGEESAMIESIEGKRGEPRLRPPYIAEVGLFGRPTLEHNFETLYWVRDIALRGAAWHTSFGRHGRTGLRSFSVSGRVRLPGLKLAPAGITLRELVDEYCGGMAEGHTLYGYLPGGASGGILPATLADVPLDFDTLQPHGSFIGSAAVTVLSQVDRARDAALNAMRFFADESCGQCTPCRVGTDKAARLMTAPHWDQATLDDLSQVMADASICGLGQAAPNVVRCVQRYFPDEVK